MQHILFTYLTNLMHENNFQPAGVTKGKMDSSWGTVQGMLILHVCHQLWGLMAVPTDLPYCLVYPNTYLDTVPAEDQHHFNVQGGPPGLCLCTCICCTLLQHTVLSEAHQWQYHGSQLVIPRGAQYDTLLPMITMPCNH